jgi:Aerotolerance regulator N-terminal
MNFLQPFILFALPLIGLPILIHLINQRRYRTVHWAATMFLLQAKRMARGMARLRYWLIMLARMLAVAGLIFAIARPMAGGWLGLTTGGAPELTIILLDRSASMEEIDPATGVSHRESSLIKLADLLSQFDSESRIVLFDSATDGSQELNVAADLTNLPSTAATQTSADIPRLLQSAVDYIVTNEVGRADVWICSDLRHNDWEPSGGRWNELRTQLQGRTGVRLYVLSSTDQASDNLSISVSGVHRRVSPEGAEVVMDIRVTRATPVTNSTTIPLTLTIDGATSSLQLELTGSEVIRNGHAIPVDADAQSGWGRIELPHDANPADNGYQFVYAEPAVRMTAVVSDDTEVAGYLRIAAGSAASRDLTYRTDVVSAAAASTIPWTDTALLLWQAPLPTGAEAELIANFVAEGRSVIFFPPDIPGGVEFFESSWGDWRDPEDHEFFPVTRWKTDADLLANSQSGSPLPVGQLRTFRSCSIEQQRALVLAPLQSGPPLLSRIATDSGGVWFCSTLPTSDHSNLVSNGIVLYVMIQRALAAGAASLGAAGYRDCGFVSPDQVREWTAADDRSSDIPPSQRSLRGGVYQTGRQLVALNRPLAEDRVEILSDDELSQTLSGLDFVQIRNATGSDDTLASEVWRTFLILMIVALLAEALLCVPGRSSKTVKLFPHVASSATES